MIHVGFLFYIYMCKLNFSKHNENLSHWSAAFLVNATLLSGKIAEKMLGKYLHGALTLLAHSSQQQNASVVVPQEFSRRQIAQNWMQRQTEQWRSVHGCHPVFPRSPSDQPTWPCHMANNGKYEEWFWYAMAAPRSSLLHGWLQLITQHWPHKWNKSERKSLALSKWVTINFSA